LADPQRINLGAIHEYWLIADYGGHGLLGKFIYEDKPGLNLDQLRTLICPFPPLAEQRVIVAKVDGLLTMVDKLEQQVKIERSKRKS
jgi:type I restriction enzyme S subunit